MNITRNSGFSRVMAIVMMFGIVASTVAIAAGSPGGSRPRLSSDSTGITNDGLTTTFPGGLCTINNASGTMSCRGYIATTNDVTLGINQAVYLNGNTHTAFIYYDGANTNIGTAGASLNVAGNLSTTLRITSTTDVYANGSVNVAAAGGAAGSLFNNSKVIGVNTAPTLSGFGTSPSVVASNGTYAFQINVGTGGVATTGTITMPAATAGWSCTCEDVTTQSTTVARCRQTGLGTTTSVPIGQFTSADVAGAWVASDKLLVNCIGY